MLTLFPNFADGIEPEADADADAEEDVADADVDDVDTDADVDCNADTDIDEPLKFDEPFKSIAEPEFVFLELLPPRKLDRLRKLVLCFTLPLR